MKIEEYRKLALRTESQVTNELLYRLSQSARISHGILGLVTEAVELQNGDNVKEELGDIEWYLNLIRDAFQGRLQVPLIDADMSMRCYRDEGVPALKSLLVRRAGDMADLLKRHIFYGKDWDTAEVATLVFGIEELMFVIRYKMDLTRDDVLIANIQKLQSKTGRYPDVVFSAEKAINRNVEEEQRILNAAVRGDEYVFHVGPVEQTSYVDDKGDVVVELRMDAAAPFLNALTVNEFRIIHGALLDKFGEKPCGAIDDLYCKVQNIIDCIDRLNDA